MKVFLTLCCVLLYSYGAVSDEVFQEAQRILQTHKETHYEHKTLIDETKGYYRVDCSSFVSYILRKKAPLALALLPIDANHTRSRAQNYYDYFKNLEAPNSHWMAVKTVVALERGDVIAWKYDPSLQKKDTGHVVIVSQKPVQEEPSLYRIRVMDASKGKHANDTRVEGIDGIGSGDMWFRIDKNGVPIGLYWSSKAKKESRHPIAMGRVLQ